VNLKSADEGLADGDTRTHFSHRVLDGNRFYLGDGQKCTEAQFIQYDLNVVQHWKRITAKRNQQEGVTYRMKYYQWLTLMVTKLYLDWYLMRNAAKKSQGVGFPEAGNFFPDFLLWLVDKNNQQQYLTFVDPKGFEHKVDDAKTEFYKTIKEIQAKLNEGQSDKLILNSVLLSQTDYTPDLFKQETKEQIEAKNILFMGNEGNLDYLPKLFAAAKKE